MIKIIQMKLNNFIKNTKNIIINHSFKKLKVKRFSRNLYFLKYRIRDGSIKSKIMTLYKTVHLLKTQITFKLMSKLENVEIFLGFRFKNLIIIDHNNKSKIKV